MYRAIVFILTCCLLRHECDMIQSERIVLLYIIIAFFYFHLDKYTECILTFFQNIEIVNRKINFSGQIFILLFKFRKYRLTIRWI